jgi:hypothetical protein
MLPHSENFRGGRLCAYELGENSDLRQPLRHVATQYTRPYGRLAQLGERLPYKQEVACSSHAPPTLWIPCKPGDSRRVARYAGSSEAASKSRFQSGSDLRGWRLDERTGYHEALVAPGFYVGSQSQAPATESRRLPGAVRCPFEQRLCGHVDAAAEEQRRNSFEQRLCGHVDAAAEEQRRNSASHQPLAPQTGPSSPGPCFAARPGQGAQAGPQGKPDPRDRRDRRGLPELPELPDRRGLQDR